MLIFAVKVDFDFVVNCAHWFGNGTFRVTTDDFDQLYTLHGFINGEVFNCIYALLPGRLEKIYRRFLDHVVRLIGSSSKSSVCCTRLRDSCSEGNPSSVSWKNDQWMHVLFRTVSLERFATRRAG